MAHRSRLSGFIIDCNTDDLDTAARFWSGALGLPIGELPPEEASTYVKLDEAPGELHIEVQKVTHPSRVHLDIETDDIDAEVRRLEALGAKLIAAVHTWVVMEAPTGQRFCVVRMRHPERGAEPNQW
ncbi:MAG: VOC family protein [Lysobacteraceae bacterium]|nr:MAG: VOC family protein [Xanthomonadaceae bacterium]